MSSRAPLPPFIRVAPAAKPFIRVHLARGADAKRTKCRRKMKPEDLWVVVREDLTAPVCRRCHGLPPIKMIEDPLPL